MATNRIHRVTFCKGSTYYAVNLMRSKQYLVGKKPCQKRGHG